MNCNSVIEFKNDNIITYLLVTLSRSMISSTGNRLANSAG